MKDVSLYYLLPHIFFLLFLKPGRPKHPSCINAITITVRRQKGLWKVGQAGYYTEQSTEHVDYKNINLGRNLLQRPLSHL